MVSETEGIVLRNIKTANGRSMLHIFTQRYGKISVGAGTSSKGYKSKSSLATHPFTYGSYELYKGRDTYNLNGAEVKKSFYSLSEDLDKYLAASFALELTDRVIQEDVPEPAIFSILIDFLTSMESRKNSYDTLVIAYEIKLLKALGLSPEMNLCAVCGKENPVKFSISDGGMICSDCHKKMAEKAGSDRDKQLIYDPGFDIVNTVRYFENKPMKSFENIALEEGVSEKLKAILREYFTYHLDIGVLKSESMMW